MEKVLLNHLGEHLQLSIKPKQFQIKEAPHEAKLPLPAHLKINQLKKWKTKKCDPRKCKKFKSRQLKSKLRLSRNKDLRTRSWRNRFRNFKHRSMNLPLPKVLNWRLKSQNRPRYNSYKSWLVSNSRKLLSSRDQTFRNWIPIMKKLRRHLPPNPRLQRTKLLRFKKSKSKAPCNSSLPWVHWKSNMKAESQGFRKR